MIMNGYGEKSSLEKLESIVSSMKIKRQKGILQSVLDRSRFTSSVPKPTEQEDGYVDIPGLLVWSGWLLFFFAGQLQALSRTEDGLDPYSGEGDFGSLPKTLSNLDFANSVYVR